LNTISERGAELARLKIGSATNPPDTRELGEILFLGATRRLRGHHLDLPKLAAVFSFSASENARQNSPRLYKPLRSRDASQLLNRRSSVDSRRDRRFSGPFTLCQVRPAL